MKYYSAIKNEIMPFAATWIDLEIVTLNEVNQKQKDKYHMVALICEIQNMTQMNLQNKFTVNLWLFILPTTQRWQEG